MMRVMVCGSSSISSPFFREAHHGVVHDGLHLLEGDGARIHIELAADHLAALSVFLLIGGGHRAFDSVHHHLLGDAALLELAEHRIDCFEIQHKPVFSCRTVCNCRPFKKKCPRVRTYQVLKHTIYRYCVNPSRFARVCIMHRSPRNGCHTDSMGLRSHLGGGASPRASCDGVSSQRHAT
jgi:hypothetical protein